MKLNYKRTIFVGLAFFSIMAFWNLYDFVIPLMLRDTFGLGDTTAGFIMSMDNILALFMLPLFGAISDKAGRRMPFIIGGTAAAVVLTMLLPVMNRPDRFVPFVIVLGLMLIAMGIYRSPAVALMPDVTPKPLRSKANAIINLMGALGGIYALLCTQNLVMKNEDGVNNYLPLFIAVAGIMVVAVVFLIMTINEKKLVNEMRLINYGVDPEEEAKSEIKTEGKIKLAPEVRKSLMLILASVVLWFFGYNAIVSAFSKYATQVWQQDINQAASCLLVANIAAIAAYIPIGILSSRLGRKKVILMGIALLAACFFVGWLVAASFSPALYFMFGLVGIAWASINVNSFPMVVEISRSGNIGKYTGYYYFCSMAAQIVTPIVSGALLEFVGYWTLFPYAAVFVALSFITMLLTRHGDNKPEKRTGIEVYDSAD